MILALIFIAVMITIIVIVAVSWYVKLVCEKFKFALYCVDGEEFSFPLNCTRDAFEDWVETQEFQSPYEDRMLWGNHYRDFVSELELDYGVLDVCDDDETEGYASYEIEREKYPEVLEKFRQYFIEQGLVDV